MNILLVAPMPPDRTAPGAIPVVLHALLRGLAARHEVTLVTVAGPDPAELSAACRAGELGIEVHAVERPQPPGLARWRRRSRMAGTWLLGRVPWRTIWFAEPGVQNAIDRLLHDHRFDVIAVEDNAMGGYRLPVGVPTVITEHEVRRPRPVDWRSFRIRHVAQWVFRESDWRRWPRYQTAVWDRFDRTQVFSGRDEEALRALAPHLAGRVRVTPFGIDLPDAPDRSLEVPGHLLFTGNFTHAPNVDAALWIGQEVMPRLRMLRKDARLTILGIHPPREVLALGGADIEVTGAVPDVEPYLARTSVVLAPIRIGGGMRMKVLHALAMGKAVVTTSRGVEGLEIGGEKAPLVVAEDAEGLALKTASLLDDDAARKSLGTAGRAFAERHFSADAYARRVEGTYAEVIDDRALARNGS